MADPLSTYHELDDGGVRTLLSGLPHLYDRLGGSSETWSVREVGDGALNLVFCVEGPLDAVAVKQALPFIKFMGRHAQLSNDRILHEFAALTRQARFAPYRVPEPLHFDPGMAVIVMEWLRPHKTLRKSLLSGEACLGVVEHIADFMASNLRSSSELLPARFDEMDGGERAGSIIKAGSLALVELTRRFVFEEPYHDSPTNHWTSPALDSHVRDIRSDIGLKSDVQEVKFRYLNARQAFIHGDLHTGAIMVTRSDTRIIDPEFAKYGAIGFDLGTLLGNLLISSLAWHHHEVSISLPHEQSTRIFASIRRFWNAFVHGFHVFWHDCVEHVPRLGPRAGQLAPPVVSRERYIRSIADDTLGFAGCEIIRRVIGAAHVEDFTIVTDSKQRSLCEIAALDYARTLIRGRRRMSPDALPRIGAFSQPV